MSKKIVLLNGPINSGKDFITENVMKRLGGEKQEFKKALYEHTAELFGIPYEVFIEIAKDRVLKETPDQRLSLSWEEWGSLCNYLNRDFGPMMGSRKIISPRDALIYTSELVYKPEYGEAYFGQHTADVIENSESGLHFVADSGFFDEASVLADRFGADNVILIRIHREGCEFSQQDSRSYINLDELGVKTLDLDNNKDIKEVVSEVVDYLWINWTQP